MFWSVSDRIGKTNLINKFYILFPTRYCCCYFSFISKINNLTLKKAKINKIKKKKTYNKNCK